MYDIQYDADNNILHYRVVGFWDMAQLTMFQKDILAEVKRIKAVRENFDVLCDSIDFAVQPADVATGISNMVEAAVRLTTGRKAFAVRTMLGKLQYERMLPHPSVRVFLSLAEARAWLQTPREGGE